MSEEKYGTLPCNSDLAETKKANDRMQQDLEKLSKKKLPKLTRCEKYLKAVEYLAKSIIDDFQWPETEEGVEFWDKAYDGLWEVILLLRQPPLTPKK